MKASTNCFVVVVGGKYLRLMDNVIGIVDNVTEDVGRRPLAVFYVTKDEKITSFYDQPFQLPLVNNLKLLLFLSLGKGSIKKKSGIFQIWSDPPTHPCNRKKSGKNKKFYF